MYVHWQKLAGNGHMPCKARGGMEGKLQGNCRAQLEANLEKYGTIDTSAALANHLEQMHQGFKTENISCPKNGGRSGKKGLKKGGK